MDESFSRAIERLHAAMADVANGDVRAIVALHSTAGDVTSFYGWGGYEKGHAAVVDRWGWAGEQFKGGTVSYENLAADASGDLAFTVDIETSRARLREGAEPVAWSNRVVHVFRRENGEWRLVNRHASRLTERREPAG